MSAAYNFEHDGHSAAREQNPQDGRSAYATLTAEGLSRYRKAAPTYLAAIEQKLLPQARREELRTVGEVLQRVLAD